ncbi:MAG: hypothetical protein KN64_14615 [Sulfurovum sp. AS07-7]|nr:MAG: hypothetical protein KN64_14615 [Sulfurovum sp. AS07-7]
MLFDWWEELNTQTKRDQLSLAYVLWKNGENFNFMDENARGNKIFRLKLHTTERKSGIKYILNKKNEHIDNYPNGKLSYINKLLKMVFGKK